MKKFISLILVILMMSGLNCATYPSSPGIASVEEWEFLRLLNINRALPVSIFEDLQNVSDIRADELLNHFGHYRPDQRPWYTALSDGNITFDSKANELICSNFTTGEAAYKALITSSEGYKLLGDLGHVGIGYSFKYGEKNKSGWSVITLPCRGYDEITVINNGSHLSYGLDISESDCYLKLKCEHGLSYMPLSASCVIGYDSTHIGKQTLEVSLGGASTSCTVYCDYKDVRSGHWFYDSVMSCTDAGFFSGMGDGYFAPGEAITREMFVTALAKFSGEEIFTSDTSSFIDVSAKRWSAPYIEWAAHNGIIYGYDDGKFLPSQAITRQEICSVLMRYALNIYADAELEGSEIPFTDKADISSWAREGVEFCYSNGIVSGDADGSFYPKRAATRCQVAVMLDRFNSLVKE